MGASDVALAALGLAATTVGALIWVVKYLANTLSKDIREHTLAAQELTTASREAGKESKKAAAASNQVLKFMQNLNGKLEGAVIAKAESLPGRRSTD